MYAHTGLAIVTSPLSIENLVPAGASAAELSAASCAYARAAMALLNRQEPFFMDAPPPEWPFSHMDWMGGPTHPKDCLEAAAALSLAAAAQVPTTP